MTFLRTTWAWLVDEPRQRTGVRVLQTAIGLAMLFRVFTEAPFASFLYGPNGIGTASGEQAFGRFFGRLVDLPFQSEIGTRLVLFAMAAGALALVVGYRTRAATAMLLVIFNLVVMRNLELGDGGDNVTQIVLIYMLFLLPVGKQARRGSLAVWFHNLAVAAIAAQLMILYLTSGFAKATGTPWSSGIALYNISQVDTFSHPALREIFKNPFVVTAASYSAMFLLIWFPIAMFSKFKPLWLAAGISFHIGIAGYMGLVTFSTVMIGLEMFFVTDEEYRSLREKALSFWRKYLATRRARDDAEGEGGDDVVPAVAEKRLLLFIDGFCPTCQKTGRLIERIDARGQVRIVSFRHTDEHLAHGLSPDALRRRMHVVDLRTGAIDAGCDAVQTLTRRLPVLWPLRPLIALLKKVGYGDWLYDALAARRRIIPDARACEGDALCQAAPIGPASEK